VKVILVTASTGVVRDAEGNLKVWDEESGELHRELEDFRVYCGVSALATFLSPDGQQPRLLAGSTGGELRVYDPEAGSMLNYLIKGDDPEAGYDGHISDVACIASSSAAPHHPCLVSVSQEGTKAHDCVAKVWDGETGGRLADLRGDARSVTSVAVWKEHTGGHDRIATGDWDGHVRVWDGEAFTLLHDLHFGSAVWRVSAFESAEGPTRLLVALGADSGLQVWDPEEGRLLHDGINRGCPHPDDYHLLEVGTGPPPPGHRGLRNSPRSAPR
jgi:WD40 repeat protein